MKNDISRQLLGWLRESSGSWLEEEQGDKQRLLRHRARDGTSLHHCPLTVELISILLELNWQGQLERRAKDGVQPLYIYTLIQEA